MSLTSPHAVLRALALVLLVVAVWVSRDFGATWDEPQQRQKAHHLIAYWTGQAAVLEVPDDGAHLYGAPLDVVAAALERHVTADPYVIRHALLAAMSWLGVLITGLLARRVYGATEAALSVVLLLVSPFFVAHSANNPKDLPFAVVGVSWLLMLSRLPSHDPLSRPRDLLCLALLLGVGLNVRAGALLFWGYLVVFTGVRALEGGRPPYRAALTLAPRLLGVLVGGIAMGWVAWPWAYAQPLVAPFRALALLSRFPWGGQVLFGGETYSGLAVPDTYVVQWFWMVLSPVVLAGAGASLLLPLSGRSQRATIALWSVVLFPILYVTGTRATLYDSVRHLLFVLPPLAVLAGAGLAHTWRRTPLRWRWVVGVLMAAGFVEPAWFQIRNHPNQAAYVQPLAGGPRAAFGQYDLDYWGNCMLAALRDAAGSSAPDGPVFVTGWPLIVLEANAPRVPSVRVVPEGDSRAQRSVRLVRGSREEVLGLATAPAVLSRISTQDGAVLCVVQRLSE